MPTLPEHWQSGFWWLCWNFAGMLGLWGVGWLIFFFLEDAQWLELVDGGQLFLYSVGVLAQVMYILTKERKITTLPMRSFLTYMTVVCLLMSTLLFSGTVLSNFAELAIVESKLWVLRLLGIITFVASISMGFAVTIAAEDREDVDLGKLSEQNVSRLADRISGI